MIGMLIYYAVVLLALYVTGLFLWGAWKVTRSISLKDRIAALLHALGLSREEANPILTASDQAWEQGGVMNPAVIEVGGKSHMFYRAVGADGVSRIGYASSKDGAHIDERLPYPVFALVDDERDKTRGFAEHTGLMKSGGSFAGVEDPRAVVIDDRMYLSFSAFRGWNSLRMAVSSIKLEDLLQKKWVWTPPAYLSAPSEVHKNWVLFPEKIGGRYAILHGFDRTREHAQIDYVDSLTTDPTPYIKSDASFRDAVDPRVWDSRIRGAGPPPLKTGKGWLVLYHANDVREPEKYKMGAMLLDLTDPTKVIARSPVPVLEPNAPYENSAKPGVVYACGATITGDELRVYYGGGDNVVCAGKMSLSTLLKKLVPINKVDSVLASSFATI